VLCQSARWLLAKPTVAVAFKVLENLKNACQIARSSLMPNEALIPNQGEPS